MYMPGRNKLIVLSAAVLTSAALAAVAADKAKTPADIEAAQKSGEVLPQDDIIQRAKTQQPGKITEIELDRKHGRYVYEVDVVDDQGVKTEMKFDAKTGELLSRKVERDDEGETAEDDD
jgi:uncharacterized membrane protein YkoI